MIPQPSRSRSKAGRASLGTFGTRMCAIHRATRASKASRGLTASKPAVAEGRCVGAERSAATSGRRGPIQRADAREPAVVASQPMRTAHDGAGRAYSNATFAASTPIRRHQADLGRDHVGVARAPMQNARVLAVAVRVHDDRLYARNTR